MKPYSGATYGPVLSGRFTGSFGSTVMDLKAGRMASNSQLRIGIAGCGRAARIHLDRLLALDEVAVVGCADSDHTSAESLAALVAQAREGPLIPCFDDHRKLLKQVRPDALCVFTPHLWHYRLAMEALQEGCHVFIEKPLSTNVQEASDIVGLARGRSRLVAVGHQYRLCPSLVEARRLLRAGAIGQLRMVTATIARPWLAAQMGQENSWRFDSKVSGGGMLADAGDHLIDALLWTTGESPLEVCAVQSKMESGLDLVTAAAIRLQAGTPVSLSISGVSPGLLFELNYFGERGQIRATDKALLLGDEAETGLNERLLPPPAETIDQNFVAAVLNGLPLCCPADQAIDTVRLIEALYRLRPANSCGCTNRTRNAAADAGRPRVDLIETT